MHATPPSLTSLWVIAGKAKQKQLEIQCVYAAADMCVDFRLGIKTSFLAIHLRKEKILHSVYHSTEVSFIA